ncbi:hypothetical protein [Thalassospira sp. HJ]|uniref:hypothetical protein n=1 Tax=Thalassospira sp. HJ TaxID=1616823 RepID=UPI000AA4C10C|nr:hypothetical protein [Thalassospira sp. HJ]
MFIDTGQNRKDNLNIERSPPKANVGTSLPSDTGDYAMQISKKAGAFAIGL